MKANLFLLVMLLAFAAEGQRQMPLFPIIEKNKTGFINQKGEVVIPPLFRSAGDFSEGLAAVRIKGYYGYIDQKGVVAIPPQFDFATAFTDGYAIVFRGEKPQYIDKTGKVPFVCDFARITPFENGHAMVSTPSGRIGMIDKQGKLTVDTAFSYIETIEPGLFLVRANFSRDDNQVGIIDHSGNFIAPFGRFLNIETFNDGFAQATIDFTPAEMTEEKNLAVFIDTRGNIIFQREGSKKDGWLWGDFNDGICIIELYKYWLPEQEDVFNSSDKNYQGFINRKGEILLNDTLIDRVMGFLEQRAFIQNTEGDWFLVDTTIRKVTEQAFSEVLGGFNKGYAFVKTKDQGGYGLINREGQWVIPPKFDDIHYTGIVDDYFFFSKEDFKEGNGYEVLYGVCDVSGKVLVEPMLEDFDPEGFKDGLLKVQVKGKLAYINRAGAVVWEEKKVSFVGEMDIDFMNRGYFYAHSEPDKNDLGGFARSGNVPQKIERGQGFSKNQLSIVVKTDETALFDEQWDGYKLYVANTTKGSVQFNAQDSRLYLNLQALDAHGEWRDIEYLPSSWCGNSYHTLTLKKDQYWSFSIPKYNGAIKTKIRAALTYITSISKSEERGKDNTITIYSNEFAGSVNPGQFWRKQDYYPAGIMDPYDD